jgi:uncharacterized protein (DUF885 family)
MSDMLTRDDQTARDLADRFWDQLLELEPMLGTSVGDERFDDRLPDPSEDGLAERARMYRESLEKAGAIDRAALSVIERTALDVLEACANREIEAIDARLDRLQAASHIWGPGQLVGQMGSLQRADSPERLERYVTRLRAVPAYLDALEPILDGAVEAGQTCPGVMVDRSIAQVERILAAPLDASPAMVPVAGDPHGAEVVSEVLRDGVLPAHERYLELLRRYRPSATETIGLSALPGGDRMYAAQILSWTSLPLEAAAVHELGVTELAKIQEERSEAARRLGFDEPAAAIEAYRASHRPGSREEMLDIARRQVASGWDAAPAMFGRLPAANCEVRAVEEFREADMPFAFYNPATADGSRPGVYYVNTYEPEQRPLHQLATTTHHEANPGHHFQISIEHEIEGRPALRRFGGFLAGSAFTEGWGLYSERLADEMGLYESEYERLGMLDSLAFRANRLIVDTGIHAFEWDRERAVAQMGTGGLSPVDAQIEVDRYIAMPGQALAYMIGMLEIRSWREAAERADSFDLPAFHDRLLSLGSLPLPSLRREMGGA